MAGILGDVSDAFRQLLGDKRAFEGKSAHHELRGRLLALLAITLTLELLGTLVVTSLRGGHYQSSFVWTTSSLLTGGAPHEITKHLSVDWVGLVLELWSITAIGVLAGSFGAFFHRMYLEREESSERRTI